MSKERDQLVQRANSGCIQEWSAISERVACPAPWRAVVLDRPACRPIHNRQPQRHAWRSIVTKPRWGTTALQRKAQFSTARLHMTSASNGSPDDHGLLDACSDGPTLQTSAASAGKSGSHIRECNCRLPGEPSSPTVWRACGYGGGSAFARLRPDTPPLSKGKLTLSGLTLQTSRCGSSCAVLTLCCLFVFLSVPAVLASGADTPVRCSRISDGVVEVRPLYTNDLDSGLYGAGRYGEALGLCGKGPRYPVVYNRATVSAGTLAFWFKPCRATKRTFIRNAMVSLADARQTVSVHFYMHREKGRQLRAVIRSPALPRGRWYVLNRGFPDELADRFHHFAFSWSQTELLITLNGAVVAEIARNSPGAPEQWLAPFAGNESRLTVEGPCVWYDDVVVLDRALSRAELATAAQAQAPWQPGPHTVLQAGFDRSLLARAGSARDGALLRVFARSGVPNGMFRVSDQKQLDITLINTGAAAQDATVKATIRDLRRHVVLQHTQALAVPGFHRADLAIDLERLGSLGLFWAETTVADSAGHTIRALTIPFALTRCPDVRQLPTDSVQTGLVVEDSLTPPIYSRWERVTGEARWRALETRPDDWYFNRLDMVIGNKVATQREPVLILGNPPDWRLPDDPGKRILFNPSDLDGWRGYIRRLATRYKGQVHHYMFVGEAYHKVTTGQITTAEYITMVNSAAEVLHAVDPRNQVGADMCRHKTGYTNAVAKNTADTADVYIIHPYGFVNGMDASRLIDDQTLQDSIVRVLREHGAPTRLADAEVGIYTFMNHAVHPDGYPMTLAEFNRSGNWANWPKHHLNRGKESFVDFFTGAFRVVRGTVMDAALGCCYTLQWSSRPGGFSSLNYRANAPSPMSTAFANMCGFLAQTEFVRRLDLGTASAKAYVFRHRTRNDYLILAFDDAGSGSSACFRVGAGDVQVLDHYANPAPHTRIGPMLNVELRPLTPLTITGIREAPRADKPFLALLTPTEPVLADAECRITLALTNPFEYALEGEVELVLPDGFTPSPATTVRVPAGASEERHFETHIPGGVMGRQAVSIRFTDATGKLPVLTQTFDVLTKPNVAAPVIATPPRIDGRLDEWGAPADFPIRVDTPDHVRRGNPYTKSYVNVGGTAIIDWTGPQDCSVLATVARDEENLFVAIRVYDEKQMPHPSGFVLGTEDRADVERLDLVVAPLVDPEEAAAKMPPRRIHLTFLPPTPAFPAIAMHVRSPRGINQRGLPVDYLHGLVLRGRPLANGYTIELKLPLRNISAEPATLKRLGFDLVAVDLDETGDSATVTELTWAGQGTQADPQTALAGELLLR